MKTTSLAGLEVRVVDGADEARAPVTVLLHGFGMRADDLAPFGASMRLPGVFLFPEGPVEVPARGRAWWTIDTAGRDQAVARGDERDLSDQSPPGLKAAGARAEALLAEVRQAWPGRPVVLGGFSQGAILSVEVALHTATPPDALALLSAARVTAAAWAPRLSRLRGLPIFQSHGRLDRELSFAAAQVLRDDLVTAGAALTWAPFDGGHEIPLPVLRQLKRFLGAGFPGRAGGSAGR